MSSIAFATRFVPKIKQSARYGRTHQPLRPEHSGLLHWPWRLDANGALQCAHVSCRLDCICYQGEDLRRAWAGGELLGSDPQRCWGVPLKWGLPLGLLLASESIGLCQPLLSWCNGARTLVSVCDCSRDSGSVFANPRIGLFNWYRCCRRLTLPRSRRPGQGGAAQQGKPGARSEDQLFQEEQRGGMSQGPAICIPRGGGRAAALLVVCKSTAESLRGRRRPERACSLERRRLAGPGGDAARPGPCSRGGGASRALEDAER